VGYELSSSEDSMDSDLRDGALLEATFQRVFTHAQEAFATIGIKDVAAQAILLVGVTAGLLWLLVRRVAKIGYRINDTVGIVVEILTIGPLLTFLLVALRAWVEFRQPSIARAVIAFFKP
jgi:hypothetical protein